MATFTLYLPDKLLQDINDSAIGDTDPQSRSRTIRILIETGLYGPDHMPVVGSPPTLDQLSSTPGPEKPPHGNHTWGVAGCQECAAYEGPAQPIAE